MTQATYFERQMLLNSLFHDKACNVDTKQDHVFSLLGHAEMKLREIVCLRCTTFSDAVGTSKKLRVLQQIYFVKRTSFFIVLRDCSL